MEDVYATLLITHRPDLAGQQVRFTPIKTGKFNLSVRLDVGDEAFVLRIAPPDDAVFVFYERRMIAQEAGLHALLRDQTTVPVPRVVGYDDSRRLIDRDYIILEMLPGRPWSECVGAHEGRILFQLGQMLAQVHQQKADQYGYLGPHRPLPPAGSWVVAFEQMWQRMIEDVAEAGFYNAAERDRLRFQFRRYRDLFDRPVAAHLLHMDVWQQNVLIAGSGRVTGLLDWDRALWGDPEIEFAVLDYCGLSRREFWKGYGRPREKTKEAEIRRIFYLLYELQKYIVIYSGRFGEPGRAAVKKRQVLDMARLLENRN